MPDEEVTPVCPPCRGPTPTLSPGVELPSGQRSGQPYPQVPLEPVYPYEPERLEPITEGVVQAVSAAVEAIHNSITYSRYWDTLTAFQLAYNGQQWEVDAECDTMLHSSESRPGRPPVPCPPNSQGTSYSTCRLCGHFPCRWMFHIVSPETGEGRWIGDECVVNYAASAEQRPQIQQAISTYRGRVTERMANLRANTRRIILGRLWLATHTEWRRSGQGLANRLYWQVAKLSMRMMRGGAVVGREKYDYDMAVTGRMDHDSNVERGLETGRHRQEEMVRAQQMTPPTPPIPQASELQREVDYLLAHYDRLDDWTQSFSRNVNERLRAGRPLTERQLEWVHRSSQRLRRSLEPTTPSA